MNPRFSIIIPTYKDKCKELLIPCLESIIKFTDLSDVEIIVVANGCIDETREYVTSLSSSHPQIKLLWFGEGIGYTRATNEGIKIAQGEYFVLLNNDTQVLDNSGWLNVLVEPFLEDKTVGLTGPMKELCPHANREFILFFCCMISRKAIDKIGLLDEIFSPGYGEDCDMAARAEDAGFKIIQVPDNNSRDFYDHNKRTGSFPLYHIGNESFKNWPGGEDLLRRNNNILRERYNKSKVNIERAKQCDGFMLDQELIWLATKATTSKIFIECGSWHGKSSRAIADNLPSDGVLYCIDTWKGSAAEQETFHSSAKWLDGDHAYYEFLQNNFDLIQSGKIIPLRMTSKNAAAFFKERSIHADTVFIDAGHLRQEVIDDINQWKDVVKAGGTLCGHDYVQQDWIEVKQAVDQFFPNVNVAPNTSIWHHVITKDDFKPFKSCIYDCIPFNNELDLLEKRFEELFDTVDRFVISEATITHAGKSKPLYFRDNLRRFEKYLSKVSHVVIEANEFPAKDSWSIERYQREGVMRALTQCKDNDTIIISDLDEIPNAEAVKNYDVENGIMSFEMQLFYYNMNVRAKDKWTEAKILPYGLLKQLTPCGARYTKAPVIPDGGKHLSYFGGVESIKKKIEDTAHQELNIDEFKDIQHIERVIAEGKDLFGRNLEFEIIK